MPASELHQRLQQTLAQMQARGCLRQLPVLNQREGKYIWCHQQKLLNLSSNDYLGLATNLDLLQRFYHAVASQPGLADDGLSASASRLLAGNHSHYPALEADLAKDYGREAALVLNSGYHANIGILPALLGKNDVVLADRLVHASLVDGIRLSGARFFRFAHLNYLHLEQLLRQHRSKFQQVIIVSESVFSMDGDCADLKRLVELKHKYQTWLYIDEAHALGVFGPQGLGLCEACGVMSDVDILLGTFGKALAGLGAFIVTDQVIKDYLVNKMRSLIYTTALPPVVVRWNHFIWKQLAPRQDQRQHLLHLADQLRAGLQAAGCQTSGNSQIVPVFLGEEEKTVRMAQALQAQGFWLMPIRPPTVPQHTSRLRISLTAQIEWKDIAQLPESISQAEK